MIPDSLQSLTPVDRKELLVRIDERLKLKIEPGQTASIMRALLLVRKMPASDNPRDYRAAYAKENTLGVIIPVEDFQKMLSACDAVKGIFQAMEALGEFASYARSWDVER